jgi:cell division inhibitor SulA
MEAVRANLTSVAAIKEAIQTGDFSYAAQCLMELSDEAKRALWRAPSKGGIWTTAERKAMQADGEVGRAVSQIKRDEAA